MGDDRLPRERYRIADLTVEVDTVRVLRDGGEIALPRLSFDLLVTLARRAPQVVTTEQLMDDVWPGLIVGPETVTQRVKLIRDALVTIARIRATSHRSGDAGIASYRHRSALPTVEKSRRQPGFLQNCIGAGYSKLPSFMPSPPGAPSKH